MTPEVRPLPPEVDYLAHAALNLLTHPAPEPTDLNWYRRDLAHRLAVAFLRDALKQLGRAVS